MSRRLVALATSTFLVGVTASMVWGDGGDTSQIHACVAKDGTLRIVGATATCKTQETPVHWSIVGPAGPAGPAGPQGERGTDGVNGVDGQPGARGPSDGYVVSGADSPMYFDASTNPELVVAALSLGPGNYVLNAKVLVGNVSGQASEDIVCSLRQGPFASVLVDQASVRPSGGAPSAAGSLVTLALAGGVNLAGGDDIKVICTTSIGAPAGAFAQFARLSAVQVETLTTQ